MQIEDLNFSHQAMLENKFRQMNLALSEYCFSNLYLFRKIHRYQVIQFNDNVFIKGLTKDNVSFIMLTSDPEQISDLIWQKLSLLAEILFPIPEHWLSFLEQRFQGKNFKEEESDYVYASSKFYDYRGRHLDNKRNQVHQLLRSDEVKIVHLSGQLNAAQEILENWKTEHQSLDETDYLSCKEAIDEFHRLHLNGYLLYVNQHPSGFTITDRLSKDYYAIHFSKTLRSIKGATPYLFQETAKLLGKECLWINLEQDLGIPTLRESKLSYQPDQLLKKWRIHLSCSP